MNREVYLDNNATTKPLTDVRTAVYENLPAHSETPRAPTRMVAGTAGFVNLATLSQP